MSAQRNNPLQGGKHTARSRLNPVYPSHRNRAKSHTPSKKKHRKKEAEARKKGKRIQCAICGKWYAQLTPTHLQKHGFTSARYQRVFNAGVRPGCGPSPSALASDAVRHGSCLPAPADSLTPSEASISVAEALLGNRDFVDRLADETAEVIFSSSLRDQFRLALCSVLSARLELHGRAVASLQAIRKELDEPWRLAAGGGPNGEPTPTPHLLGMAAQAHAEVTKTEEALLKAIKMAASEARDNKAALTGLHGRPSFTGEAEVIPVPPELSPGEREICRGLLGLLTKEMEARAEARREPRLVQAHPVEEAPEGNSTNGGEGTSGNSSPPPVAGTDPFPTGL